MGATLNARRHMGIISGIPWLPRSWMLQLLLRSFAMQPWVAVACRTRFALVGPRRKFATIKVLSSALTAGHLGGNCLGSGLYAMPERRLQTRGACRAGFRHQRCRSIEALSGHRAAVPGSSLPTPLSPTTVSMRVTDAFASIFVSSFLFPSHLDLLGRHALLRGAPMPTAQLPSLQSPWTCAATASLVLGA